MAFILVPTAAVAPVLTLPDAAFLYVRTDRPEQATNVNIREQERQIAPGTRAIAPLESKWTVRSRAAFIVGAALACWAPPVLLVLRFT